MSIVLGSSECLSKLQFGITVSEFVMLTLVVSIFTVKHLTWALEISFLSLSSARGQFHPFWKSWHSSEDLDKWCTLVLTFCTQPKKEEMSCSEMFYTPQLPRPLPRSLLGIYILCLFCQYDSCKWSLIALSKCCGSLPAWLLRRHILQHTRAGEWMIV